MGTLWDKNLPSANRFTVLSAFGGAAVLDNNTGLVWEQTSDGSTHNWIQAKSYCLNKNIGVRGDGGCPRWSS